MQKHRRIDKRDCIMENLIESFFEMMSYSMGITFGYYISKFLLKKMFNFESIEELIKEDG